MILALGARALLLVLLAPIAAVALLAWRIGETIRQDWPAMTGDDSEAW